MVLTAIPKSAYANSRVKIAGSQLQHKSGMVRLLTSKSLLSGSVPHALWSVRLTAQRLRFLAEEMLSALCSGAMPSRETLRAFFKRSRPDFKFRFPLASQLLSSTW